MLGSPIPARAAEPSFEARKASRIAQCEAIPANQYRAGLLFNPPGYQTFFIRSECFQKLAVEERDLNFCGRVRERDSWFFEGWFISPQNCRKLVVKRQEQDDQEFASLDPRKISRLAGLDIRRDGNGRDFDLLVTTEGKFSGQYLLEIFLDRAGDQPALLYRESVQSGLLNGTRFLLLRNKALTEALAGRSPQGTYTIRGELGLVLTDGNRFYYHRLPLDRLTSTQSLSVDFAKLPPWQPDSLN